MTADTAAGKYPATALVLVYGESSAPGDIKHAGIFLD